MKFVVFSTPDHTACACEPNVSVLSARNLPCFLFFPRNIQGTFPESCRSSTTSRCSSWTGETSAVSVVSFSSYMIILPFHCFRNDGWSEVRHVFPPPVCLGCMPGRLFAPRQEQEIGIEVGMYDKLGGVKDNRKSFFSLSRLLPERGTHVFNSRFQNIA